MNMILASTLDHMGIEANDTIFSPGMAHAAGRRRNARGSLDESALTDRGGLEPHYQPQVTLDGRLVGVEALARWRHPTHGLLEPAAFLPALNSHGALPGMDREMIRHAMATARRHAIGRPHGAAPLSVSVNVCADHLAAHGFSAWLDQIVTAADTSPSALTLEVLETAFGGDVEHLVAVLAELRGRGHGITIDDFGTGASDFIRVRELPISGWKIARTLADGVADDRRQGIILGHLLAMGEQLGITTVVEGIERVEDWAWLQRHAPRSTVVQGYYVCRPMSAASLYEWMAISDGTLSAADVPHSVRRPN